MRSSDVTNAVRSRAVALVGLDWRPFDRCAVLRFRNHTGGPVAVRLGGVHLLATRQSLLGEWGYIQLGEEHWEDWYLNYFDIQTDSEFLERFLAQELGLPSQVVVYSLSGVGLESAKFERPVHVALAAGGGHLDVVCETVQMEGE